MSRLASPHSYSPKSHAFLSGLALAGLALTSLAFLPSSAGAVQNPHAAHLLQVGKASVQTASVKSDSSKNTQVPAPIVVPPGYDLYTALRGDSIPSVARKYLKKTKYLTSSELTEAIRSANGNRPGTFLKPGEQILIPGILEAPIVEKSVTVARDFEARAIYLTGVMAGSDHGARIIRH